VTEPTGISQRLFSPRAVQERLEVNDSTLRRYARSYEDVWGVLPKDYRRSRLYPAEAVTRLERAKGLVDSGKVNSFRQALESLKSGRKPTGEPVERLEDPRISDALRIIHEEILALRAEVAEVRRQNRELKNRLVPDAPKRRGGPGLS
jgi:DNA-binding transcriptional MerR regulator